MAVRTVASPISLTGVEMTLGGGNKAALFITSSPSFVSLQQFGKRKRSVAVVVAALQDSTATMTPLTGIVFQPFEEVKSDAFVVPVAPHVSLARQRYSEQCEAAVNEQINVEYNVSYVYHSLYAYFDRDNVALKGLAKFFKESSEEEREHAEKLMAYQQNIFSSYLR